MIHSFAFENECGSASSLPSSPSSFTKPPIGSQLSVYRVSPFAAQDLRAGREADPELEHADLRPARRDEVPDLVDEDERAEQQDEHEDRDQDPG